MKTLIVGFVMALFVTPTFAQSYTPPDKTNVPEAKHSNEGLYLTAPEAFEMKSRRATRSCSDTSELAASPNFSARRR